MGMFLLAFHGGRVVETEEESAQVIAAWTAWFESLGTAVIDVGGPSAASVTIATDGSTQDVGGASSLSGYSVLTADSLDAAIEMARGAPIFAGGGSVEVCEIVPM